MPRTSREYAQYCEAQKIARIFDVPMHAVSLPDRIPRKLKKRLKKITYVCTGFGGGGIYGR